MRGLYQNWAPWFHGLVLDWIENSGLVEMELKEFTYGLLHGHIGMLH